MIFNSNKFKIVFVYSISLLLTLIVFFPFGKTDASNTTSKIDFATSPTESLFDVNNMKPGDWATRTLVVKNKGNVPFTYNTKSNYKNGSKKFFNQLFLKLSDKNGVVYEGKLSGFKKLQPRKLQPRTEEQLTATISFPWESGNEFQGLKTEFELVLLTSDTNINNPPSNQDDTTTDNNTPPSKQTDPPSNNTTPGISTLPKTGESSPYPIMILGFFIFSSGLILLLVKKSVIPNPFKRE